MHYFSKRKGFPLVRITVPFSELLSKLYVINTNITIMDDKDSRWIYKYNTKIENPFLKSILPSSKPYFEKKHYSGDGLNKRTTFELYHRLELEGKYGPLPPNYFDLSLSDQFDLIQFIEMLKKGSNHSTFDFSKTLVPEDFVYQRARLEEKYGLLPSNYFELTPSEQRKFSSLSRILKRAEDRRAESKVAVEEIIRKYRNLNPLMPNIFDTERNKVKPETETSFIQNVFGILCVILILWLLCLAPDVGYDDGPLRR